MIKTLLSAILLSGLLITSSIAQEFTVGIPVLTGEESASVPARYLCFNGKLMREQLTTSFKEIHFGTAIKAGAIGEKNIPLITLWMGKDDDKSITVLHEHPNGSSCIITAGKHLELLKNVKPISSISISADILSK